SCYDLRERCAALRVRSQAPDPHPRRHGADRSSRAGHTSYRVGAHGPLEYRNPDLFRPGFNHGAWLQTARQRVARARRHSEPIKHHEKHYGGEVPIWVLTEVLDFADVSRLFSGLRVADQFAVAEALNVQIDLS